MSITLKAARVNANLTQYEAAELLEVSRDSIVSWETGKTYPRADQILKIEKVYGVPFSELNFLMDNKSA